MKTCLAFFDQYLRGLIAVAAAVTLCSCLSESGSKSPSVQSNEQADNAGGGGVVDGGGGLTEKSSPELVRATLQRAIQMATETDPKNNIFVRFWLEGIPSLYEIPFSPKTLFPNLDDPPKENHSPGSDLMRMQYFKNLTEADSAVFESPALQALKSNPVHPLESGDCEEPEKKHADASVTSFDTHAEICFSIEHLTHIPSRILLQEILALVLHESIHMGGGNEALALNWQSQFSQYFAAHFGELNNPATAKEEGKSLLQAGLLLKNAKVLSERKSQSFRIPFRVARSLQIYLDLSLYLDTMALKLAFPKASAQQVKFYTNSVLAIIQEINRDFMDDPFEFGPYDIDQSHLQENLNRIGSLSDDVEQNFRALVSPDAYKSVCRLPQKQIAPVDFDLLYRKVGYYLPPLPPMDCEP